MKTILDIIASGWNGFVLGTTLAAYVHVRIIRRDIRKDVTAHLESNRRLTALIEASNERARQWFTESGLLPPPDVEKDPH